MIDSLGPTVEVRRGVHVVVIDAVLASSSQSKETFGNSNLLL